MANVFRGISSNGRAPASPRNTKAFLLLMATFFLPFVFFLLVFIPHLSAHETRVVCKCVTVTLPFPGISRKVVGRLLSASGSRGGKRQRHHELKGADRRAKVVSSAFKQTITNTSFSLRGSIRVSEALAISSSIIRS